jgi:hypothetical protein
MCNALDVLTVSKNSTVMCEYCPCVYCIDCFTKHVLHNYPYQCIKCQSIWTTRWVETKLPSIRTELLESKTNFILAKEISWLPITQRTAVYTRNVKCIKEEMNHVNQHIKDLQMILKQLKKNKEELDKKLVQTDSRIYNRSCSNCKGYIDQYCICGLCNRETNIGNIIENNLVHYTENTCTWEWKGSIPHELGETIRRIQHLVYHIYPTLIQNESDTNQDLRIRYLLEDMTMDEFKKHLEKRSVRLESSLDYHSIVRNYINKIIVLPQDLSFAMKENEYQLQTNECITELNQFYHSDYLFI